jgi:carbamate kinase
MPEEKIVIALGGNAFIQRGQRGTLYEQWKNVNLAMEQVADIIMEGYRVVLTHGNGPQVGMILEWMEAASEKIPPMTMDIAGAMTQGWIGYMIQQALSNQLLKRKYRKKIVTIVNRVLVDKDDEAFKKPTKYVGPYYTEDEARKLSEEKGWVMKVDPRGGWRRVVPSPDPIINLEMEAIKHLVDAGYIVIASGGGGIPVIEKESIYEGVEAVIDKDLAGERLATYIKAEYFLILTDVEGVMIKYGRPDVEILRRITVEEAEKYYNMGEFPPGTMGPKVLSAIRFIKNGGKKAYIGHLYKALDTLHEETGTCITK